MNEVRKSFAGEPMKADAKKDIALINRYALRELSPEEIFVFNVNLCDNQIDRDLDAFSLTSLRKLEKLFIGKPLIQDHSWSAENQQGRIYKTQVVQDGPVSRLRASIYMMRTPGAEETISLIEGGILREVSIGCRINRRVCSHCREPFKYDYMTRKRSCKNGHTEGEEVDGQIVHCLLEDPTDAYEVSLVAVPAQRQAGITKGVHDRHSFSPEESAARKAIWEDLHGVKINDEAWAHIVAGEVPASLVLEAAKVRAEKASVTIGDHPNESHTNGSIKYALLPASVIDQKVYQECMTALALVRKELDLPPMTIRFFVPEEDLYIYGLHESSVTRFEHTASLYGTIDKNAFDRIYVRMCSNIPMMQKAVLHEALHVFQFSKSSSMSTENSEERAYKYQEEAFRRLYTMTERQRKDLLLEEVSI